MPSDRKDSLLNALTDMQHHQQGNHGWSVFHESLSLLAGSRSGPGSAELDLLLSTVWQARPRISDSHLITLLGIAFRAVAMDHADAARVFRAELPGAERAGILSDVFRRHRADIAALVTGQSNSFTGARRFLVPQLVLGAYAAHHRITDVRLLDIGTSLGLLPRQLNNRAVFDRFAPDLKWHPAAPEYRHIPLTARFGIDRAPLPTLNWVQDCHGPSGYYTERFAEVAWSLDQTTSAGDGLHIRELDMLDLPGLAELIRSHHINVATCNFVLYQYDESVREKVIATVTESLDRPGLLLSMEPSHDLHRMGAHVHGYRAGSTVPLHLADVSDAHLLGQVTVHAGFADIAGPGWNS